MKKSRSNKKGGLMGVLAEAGTDNATDDWTIPEYNMQAEVKILDKRKFYRYHVS
jgi:hypothetical protein